MASKANHRNNQQRTKVTWLLCYITCYTLAFNYLHTIEERK